MNILSRLFEHYRAYHVHGLSRLKYMGFVGAMAFALFYLLRFTRPDPQLHDDLVLRLIAVALLTGLALKDRWPEKARPCYIGYSYLVLLYCLPCFAVLVALQQGGGVPAISNLFIVLCFLVTLTDWRNTLVMLLAGTGIAAVIYAACTPDPKLPLDLVAQLPAFVLIVVGGNLFKVSTEQVDADRKLRANALAGSIAHEMRNPLAQIRHNLEGMQQALPPPTTTPQAHTLGAPQIDNLYRHLAESEMAVRRGLQVIAMTLDEVSAKPVDISAFSYLSAAATTEEAVHEYAFASDAERGRVRVHVIEDFDFRADETAYLFVLFNLIKNALYCMALDPGARITITVADNRVLVHDTGPGVAPDALARLFQPFASVGKAGTGLGLAYCRRVMRAFDAEIECESVLGEYTQFSLRFPEVSFLESQHHHLAVTDRAVAAFAGKRLLIVDDDATQRKATRSKLALLEAQIDEAADGHGALEALASRRYDLVLLDLRMPVLDGYAVAAEIRQGQVPANRDVRIVAYSSEPAHVASVKAQKAGMDGFVSKPCAQLPLVEALHHALARPKVEAAGTLAGRRVLLADDNPFNRSAAPDPKGRLLDVSRLESYRRIGMLDELLDDYMEEIAQLVERLEQGVADQDLTQALDALHSLLGTSGDAGASALYRLVRTIYVPMVEARSWPAQLGWLEQISATTNQTQAALKAYARMAPVA